MPGFVLPDSPSQVPVGQELALDNCSVTTAYFSSDRLRPMVLPRQPGVAGLTDDDERIALVAIRGNSPGPAGWQKLISEDQLREKIAEIGAAISRDYACLNPLVVSVLKGSVVLMADLMRAITVPARFDFIAVSSYGPGQRPSGVVRIMKDLETNVEGQHVLVIEDIIDTGLTLNYVLKMLRQRHPASLAVGTLLNRPARRLVDIDLKYVGFDLPDKFVVGYGLDYRQKYRNLPFIAELKPEITALN